MDFGITAINENRIGGDVNYIKNGGSGYYEKDHCQIGNGL